MRVPAMGKIKLHLARNPAFEGHSAAIYHEPSRRLTASGVAEPRSIVGVLDVPPEADDV